MLAVSQAMPCCSSAPVSGANECSKRARGARGAGGAFALIMLIVLVMEARSHANHSLQFASKFHNRRARGSRMGRCLHWSRLPQWVGCLVVLACQSATHTHTHTYRCGCGCAPLCANSFIMNSWLGLLAATFVRSLSQMLHSPFSIICVVCYYFYYDHEWVEGARGLGGWGSSGQPQRVINVLNWSMNRVYLPLCFTSKLSSRALPLLPLLHC